MELWKDFELSWNKPQLVESKRIPLRINRLPKLTVTEIYYRQGLSVRYRSDGYYFVFLNEQKIFEGNEKDYRKFCAK